jgi:hypothetical protein
MAPLNTGISSPNTNQNQELKNFAANAHMPEMCYPLGHNKKQLVHHHLSG